MFVHLFYDHLATFVYVISTLFQLLDKKVLNYLPNSTAINIIRLDCINKLNYLKAKPDSDFV